MALVQCNFRVSAFIAHCSRAYSKSVNKDIKKSVFVSQSKDIYTNLALEDWLYRNFDFTNHHVLMLWQNEPCVVIGRHQNPWLEANITELNNITEKGVKLARRNSGGGAVFHDFGNLNMTFFTSREHYNRKHNLEIITRALFREFQLKLQVSSREDLTLRNCKVSGTAAKLGRPSAYHHCTLLVNANKVNLSQALQKRDVGIETNATKSIRSKIINLYEENPKINNVPSLFKAIGWEYLRTHALVVKDGGMELANKQKGFQMINPTEQWFPGIQAIKDNLQSWAWRFGRTPKFTVTRSFTVPDTFLNTDVPDELKVTMVVEAGKISDVNLFLPAGLVANGFKGNVNVVTSLIGHRFSEEVLDNLEWSVGTLINQKDKFVTNCVRQVMCSV